MSFFTSVDQTTAVSVDNFLATEAALRRFNRDYNRDDVDNAPLAPHFQFLPQRAAQIMYYDLPGKLTEQEKEQADRERGERIKYYGRHLQNRDGVYVDTAYVPHNFCVKKDLTANFQAQTNFRETELGKVWENNNSSATSRRRFSPNN